MGDTGTDYDPAGHDIARAFQRQLAQAGLRDTDLTTIVHPRHYTDDELTTIIEQTGGRVHLNQDGAPSSALVLVHEFSSTAADGSH